MSPPEHLLIGFSTATAFYAAQHFVKPSEPKPVGYGKLLCVMGVAAILPDMDSFWGHYNSSNPWVGHRGMTHSIAGVAVLGLGLAILSSVLSVIFRLIPGYWRFWYDRFKRKEFSGDASSESKNFHFLKYVLRPFFLWPMILVFLSAFIGGLTHILADLPQAKSVWGGLPIYFPIKSGEGYARFGGFGLVGWYDFRTAWALIAVVGISIPAVLIGMTLKWFKNRAMKIVTLVWFVAIFGVNAVCYGWVVNTIRKSRFTTEQAWYESQMKWVAKAPPFVRKTTQEGFKIGVSLFQQARRL